MKALLICAIAALTLTVATKTDARDEHLEEGGDSYYYCCHYMMHPNCCYNYYKEWQNGGDWPDWY